jgi:hypothetical protein
MEYRSRLSPLGLPLVHVAIGMRGAGGYARGVATGWIAVGDVAFGVLVACGGLAVGGLSLGGLSLGVLAMGGVAGGLAALGGMAAGGIAVGGAAIAWHAAVGGLAIAHHYAIGGLAIAPQILGPRAPGSPSGYPIPQAPFHLRDALWLLAIVAGLVLLVQQWRAKRE